MKSNIRADIAKLLRLLADGKTVDQAAEALEVSTKDAAAMIQKIADKYDDQKSAPALPAAKTGSTAQAVAYSDGGARGNPGPAGFGVVIYSDNGEILAQESGYLGETTNNVAEYQGLIRALEKSAELGVKRLEVRADSQLMVRQMNGQYKVKSKNLISLFIKAQNIARKFEHVVYTHVRREQNREADQLANDAMDRGVL